MSRLIQKCGYIHAGNAGGYMRYIATREGVEKLQGNGPPTEKQRQLIAGLLRNFPDGSELFEYADYCDAPTVGSASAFISAALDANAHTLQPGDGYMRYISTRPGVQLHGAHGLFGQRENVDLDTALSELQAHAGNVWTVIYSLRREDAARLGYDNAAAWRALLLAQQTTLAEALKIPAQQLRWYAAFHDAGHHPHVHVMLWSLDPQQGFLTRQGFRDIRSKLTNAVFKDELQQLYQKKDVSYKALTAAAQAEMRRLLEHTACDSPTLVQKMEQLAQKLETVRGKKVYGYLKKPLKELVDSIVDDLAALPEVADCYAAWNQLQDELEAYYHEQPRQHLPLSQQKEFKVIRNLVLRAADALRTGALVFEDEETERMAEQAAEGKMEQTAETAAEERKGQMAEEMTKQAAQAMGQIDATQKNTARNTAQTEIYAQVQTYRAAKNTLLDEQATPAEKAAAIRSLETLWAGGFSVAAHLLGRIWRDGVCGVVDIQQAAHWFLSAANAGLDHSQYALGKLLQAQEQTQQAVTWYRQAAAQGNQYAQYVLGKLYLQGRVVPRDRQQAEEWLTLSAVQGNPYAQFFLERMNQYHDPSPALALSKLLRDLAGVFRANTVPPASQTGPRIDSKRRRKLLQKRLALGQKVDDHEAQMTQDLSFKP